MGGTEIEGILHLYRLETLNLAENDIQEMAQARPRAKGRNTSNPLHYCRHNSLGKFIFRF